MCAKCFWEREKHFLTHNVFLTVTSELCLKTMCFTSKWWYMAYWTPIKLSNMIGWKGTEILTFLFLMCAKCFSEREKHFLTKSVLLPVTWNCIMCAKCFSEWEKHFLTNNVFLTVTSELCLKTMCFTSKWWYMAYWTPIKLSDMIGWKGTKI